jgi:hypothetical protein
MKLKFGSNKIKLCQGISKLFRLYSKPTALLPFIGWYDPGYTTQLQPDTAGNIAAGDVAIHYWNGLIDRYNPSGSQFNEYSKESYITALNNLLANSNKRVIVDLPYWDVSGTYTTNLTSWWADIINATKNNPKVIGYYLFDEPEVWGYFNNIPELTHAQALSAYNLVKANTTKDAYSVFTDITLFNKYSGLAPFWDVFMFDAYDFITQEKLDANCIVSPPWCYTAGSNTERDYVEQRLLNWKTQVIIPNNISRIVFVMQGHGEVRQDPVTGASSSEPQYVFGMRTMTELEYNFIINILKTQFNLEGLLAWSWFYANNLSRQRANKALLLFKN